MRERFNLKNLQEDTRNLTHELMQKGEVSAYEDDEGIKLQMSNYATQALSGLVSEYYANLLQSLAGGLLNISSLTEKGRILLHAIPLTIEFSAPPQNGVMNAISPRTMLKVAWDMTLYVVLLTFYPQVVTTIPSTTMNDVVVRKILPGELGGAYANGAAGPLSAPTSGLIKLPGMPVVNLNAGLNTNVVYLNLTSPQTQNVVMVIGSIEDTTPSPQASAFYFYKNTNSMISPDFSSTIPPLYLDWSLTNVGSLSIREYGLITPIFAKANDVLTINVYANATSTENLMFNGYIAYITGR
ncbi:MAG: hypothetical protein QW752_06880 [Thermoplasmata archaeon]